MAKTTATGGASIAGATPERRKLIYPDTDSLWDGDMHVAGDLSVEGLVAGGPAASTTFAGPVFITSSVVVAVGTAGLSLAAVTGLAVTIPDLTTPCFVHARLNVSHSVANATIGGCLARTDANPTLITHGLSLQYGFVGPTTGRTSIPVTAYLAAHQPCTVQLYMSGAPDGNVTIIGANPYAPSFIWAETA